MRAPLAILQRLRRRQARHAAEPACVAAGLGKAGAVDALQETFHVQRSSLPGGPVLVRHGERPVVHQVEAQELHVGLPVGIRSLEHELLGRAGGLS